MGETLTTMNYYHSHELNLKAMESTDMIDTSTSTVEEHASRSKEGVGPRSGIYFQKFKSELYPLTVDPHDFDPRPQTPDPRPQTRNREKSDVLVLYCTYTTHMKVKLLASEFDCNTKALYTLSPVIFALNAEP